MREILFRGKRVDNGEWVEGFYVKKTDSLYGFESCYIVTQGTLRDGTIGGLTTWYRVAPETVGQYTGMKDRHGKRIFENDIVEVCGGREERYLIWWVREMSMLTAIPVDGISFNGQDYWNGYYPQFEYSTFCTMMQDPWGDFRDIRVIGNIHDNPEMIGGKENEVP